MSGPDRSSAVDLPARVWPESDRLRLVRVRRRPDLPDDALYSTFVHRIESEGPTELVDLALRSWSPMGPPPIASVFHVGRCGSTVFSRLLQAATDRFVVREAPAVSDLAQAAPALPTSASSSAWNQVGRGFGAVFDRAVILKHSSWEALALPELTDVVKHPLVFLVRDPVDVVRSMLDRHPAWIRALLHRGSTNGSEDLWRRVGSEPSGTAVGLFSRYWTSLVESMLGVPADRCLWVGYDALVERPIEVLDEVSAHIGVQATAMTATEATAILTRYAKPAALDVRHVRAPLTDASVQLVRSITADAATSLMERDGRAVPSFPWVSLSVDGGGSIPGPTETKYER